METTNPTEKAAEIVRALLSWNRAAATILLRGPELPSTFQFRDRVYGYTTMGVVNALLNTMGAGPLEVAFGKEATTPVVIKACAPGEPGHNEHPLPPEPKPPDGGSGLMPPPGDWSNTMRAVNTHANLIGWIDEKQNTYLVAAQLLGGEPESEQRRLDLLGRVAMLNDMRQAALRGFETETQEEKS